MLGIKNYKPFFLTTASQFSEVHKGELLNLINMDSRNRRIKVS